MQDCYSYFSKSSKNKKKMRDFIEVENKRRATELAASPRVENPDLEMEKVYNMLAEKHKLPRHIILTRWLSSESAVHAMVLCRDTYTIFFENESADPNASAKCDRIVDLLRENKIIAWFYFLKDVLPVLTTMNVLFQSTLPLPHLLYDKIASAKHTYTNTVGRGATRRNLMRKREIMHDTPFGAFANKFITENSRGRVKSHGSSLLPSEIKELKLNWRDLIAHCIEQLDVRFPPENMRLFELLQVVDPSLSHGPIPREKIGDQDLYKCVKDLLHIFELPLYNANLISDEEVLNSFLAFRSSAFARELYKASYKRGRDGRAPSPCKIYVFYYECLMQPALRQWAFFALYMLVFSTGNAISERGFLAMGAAKTKGRSELSVKQMLAYMMIGFNGPSVAAFAEMIDVESKALQNVWWGYIAPNNLNN